MTLQDSRISAYVGSFYATHMIVDFPSIFKEPQYFYYSILAACYGSSCHSPVKSKHCLDSVHVGKVPLKILSIPYILFLYKMVGNQNSPCACRRHFSSHELGTMCPPSFVGCLAVATALNPRNTSWESLNPLWRIVGWKEEEKNIAVLVEFCPWNFTIATR